MIVYQSTKSSFHNDVLTGDIEGIILNNFKQKLGKSTTDSEISSWKDSLMYMNMVLGDKDIPQDIGISIECQIPQTSKRIDFIISGKNDDSKEHAIIIELKRWSKADATEKDGVVKTVLGGSVRETSHPSYQAWSYAALLEGFNEAVYTGEVSLKPCAYLHNYVDDKSISGEFYQEYITKAPLFFKTDILKLQNFIKEFVKFGDNGSLLYKIDKGKIRPSKSLADSLAKMIAGNQEFIMVDEQRSYLRPLFNLAGRRVKKINLSL